MKVSSAPDSEHFDADSDSLISLMDFDFDPGSALRSGREKQAVG
jgi:hypothetical protein